MVERVGELGVFQLVILEWDVRFGLCFFCFIGVPIFWVVEVLITRWWVVWFVCVVDV